MDPASVLAGAVAGAAASDVYDQAKDKANQAINGGEVPEHGPIELRILVDLVAAIEMAIRNAIPKNKDDRDEVVHLNTTNEYRFKRRGYKHVSILTPVAINVSVVTMIGTIVFPLSVGWNPFDVPEDAQLYVAGGQSATFLNAIFRWGDNEMDMAGI